MKSLSAGGPMSMVSSFIFIMGKMASIQRGIDKTLHWEIIYSSRMVKTWTPNNVITYRLYSFMY